MEILTEWNGQPVEHVPVSLTLDSSSEDVLQVIVQAPFFDDPAPPVADNSTFIGLWDYEVVELFLLNDADQYLQVQLAPRGQFFVLLFDGERNYKRFSLPLTVSSVITGGADASWTATAEIPTDYLPYMVTRVNVYSTHGVGDNRLYEAYSPAPSTATQPDYHNLEYFAPINLDLVIPDLSSRPMSELWRNAVLGLIRYSIDTLWNGTPIDHDPVVVLLGGNENEVILSVEAPYFDDPAPDALPGEAFNGLWNYEVVEAFFLNDENQYLEVEVGPHGQHLNLLLWTKNGTYNQMRHSLPMTYSSMIDTERGTWTGTATIPVDYLPPKVTRFNAYCKHIPGEGRHEESLYPQDPTDEVSDFHALQYFRPIDLNSVVPDQSLRPMSQIWEDTIQGIFRYEIRTEWNSVPSAHSPTVFTLEGFEAGVEVNVTAPFYNDPAPGGTPGEPFYELWDYEVVEMFFLNDNEEYLEVELGPWGEHLLLMLKDERNQIKHSLPLDYVVTARENGTAPLPGMWQASALIPPSYFPPNVTRMNAYAVHGTGDDRSYEALYPAPLDDPRYPQPDFHRLELFQKMDFEFLVVDNSQYSDLWLDAIANMTTPNMTTFAPEYEEIVTAGAGAVSAVLALGLAALGVAIAA